MPASVAAALGVQFSLNWLEEDPVGALSTWFVGGPMALTFGALNHAFNSKPNAPDVTPPIFDRTQTVRQAITPWRLVYGRARVGGAITFLEDSGDNAQFHMVITLAGHEVEEIEEIWFDDEVIPLDGSGEATGRLAGFARVIKSLGNEAAGVQPFPQLVAESASKWTNAHQQTGRAKLYVRLTWNQDLYPRGIPQVSAVVKGRKVYDPRTTITAWSNNAALCIADYLMSEVGLNCSLAEIDSDQLIASANTCDEAVTLAAGGTESRYTLNGAFDTSTTPRDILPQLLSALAGYVRFIGGTWGVYAGAYATPTLTLTQDDLRGQLHVMPRLSKRDLCNAVKGLFVTEDSNWQPNDFPPVTNATYLSEDQDERIWRELNLPFTTSPATAQRIAKVELERNRQQITVEWPGKLNCFQLQAGDTVQVTLDRYGWAAKVFEVVSSTLVHDGPAGEVALGCDLVLRETASAVYDWNSGEETTVDPAPDTNLPDPFATGAAPGAPEVTEDLYATTGSAGVKTRATVTWAQSADLFVVNGGHYEVEYRLSSSSDWIRRAPLTNLSLELDDLAPGEYEFRLRGVNSLGVRSAYSPTTTKELVGLTAPPSDIENFAVQAYQGIAKFTWAKPTSSSDLDVVIGGRVYVRWSPLTTGATWEHGSLVNPDGYPGDTSIGFGPLMTGTYMAKAQDSSGNFSETEASFVVTEALITGLSTITTVTESPTFTGAKSNVAFVDAGIQLDGTTLIDSMSTLIDDWGSIDSLGGVQATGTYTFASRMDLGSVTAARLFSTIGSLAFSIDDLIDSRTNDIDDWGEFDGATIEDAEVQLMVRVTDDDPAAVSPTWGPWHALGLVADYQHRGFEFRLDFATGDPTHNRAVTSLSVVAKH